MDFVKQILKNMLEPTHSHRNESVAQIAAKLGLAPTTLYGWTNERNMPAVMIPAITRATGDTSLIEELCHLCGGMFVREPKARVGNVELRDLVREGAEAVEAICDAVEDNQVDDAEFDRCEREIMDNVSTNMTLLHNLRAMRDEHRARPRDGRVAHLRDTQERRRA